MSADFDSVIALLKKKKDFSISGVGKVFTLFIGTKPYTPKDFALFLSSISGYKYTNLEVLNSYLMAKDGIHYFFEIILVDPGRPEIQALMPWICKTKNKGRVFRGLTSAGKKARGLRS